MTMPTKIIPFHRPTYGFGVTVSTQVGYPRFALEVARSEFPIVTSQSKEKQNEHPIH